MLETFWPSGAPSKNDLSRAKMHALSPTCGPVLEARQDRPRGGLGCAVEDAWPGTGPGDDDGGPQTESLARGLWYAGVGGFETRRSLAYAGRAGPGWRPSGADLNSGVLTAREPRGTDSDGAILTAGANGVLTARVGVWVLTCG